MLTAVMNRPGLVSGDDALKMITNAGPPSRRKSFIGDLSDGIRWLIVIIAALLIVQFLFH